MDDKKMLMERIERLEERLQGLVMFLGIQGAMQGWGDIDLDDNAVLRTAGKNSLRLDHRPTSLGNAGLAHQAVIAIVAAECCRRAIQQKSAEAASDQGDEPRP